MTPEELKRLKELAEAATSGPWLNDGWLTISSDRDLAFIAAAREAVPQLIAEVERLQLAFDQQFDDIGKLDKRNLELCNEVVKLREGLKELEWIPSDDDPSDKTCPACWAWKWKGHTKNCWLKELIEL